MTSKAGVRAWNLALFVGLVWLAGTVLAATPAEPVLNLAVLESPVDTPLAEIVSGRARLGFVPVLASGVPLNARPGESTWVRIRVDLPEAAAGDWQLRVERLPIASLRLWQHDPEVRQLSEVGYFSASEASFPGGLYLALPPGSRGASTFYLEAEGSLRGALHLSMVDNNGRSEADGSSGFWFAIVYLVPLLVLVLGVYRYYDDEQPGALDLSWISLLVLFSLLVYNGHLPAWLGGSQVAQLGANGSYGISLLMLGPIMLATRQFSGLFKSAPSLEAPVQYLGWTMPLLALAALFVPSENSASLQIIGWICAALVGIAAVAMLVADSRSYRWAPTWLWLGIGLLAGARYLADQQVVEPIWLTLHGWQLGLVVVLLLYLVLPWQRAVQRATGILKRAQEQAAAADEISSEQKIQRARAQLMADLRRSLGNASEADMEWIVFRRMLVSLKPVLPQISSAVVAMNYGGEDLLIVEPKSAQERFQALLTQRSSMLRNLGRTKAPQQVTLDFDGAEGPHDEAQLAVIPLPIEKPGWGALLIERQANVEYSELELDLCTEFASLATTAAEEAAESLREHHASELDPDTGIKKREVIERVLRLEFETCGSKKKQLSILRLLVEDLDGISRRHGEAMAKQVLREVAEIARDELDYAEVLGRWGAAELLLMMPGRPVGAARELADRVQAQVAKLSLGMQLQVRIGFGEMVHGERDGLRLLIDRAGQALAAGDRGDGGSSPA